MSKKMNALVSIIITTKNEEKNIGNCLESIKSQSYPQQNIEIIVVDNNSTDKTKEIARQYTKNVFNFGPERSAQRNYGIEKSKGKYVMYLDADMVLSPTVVEKSVEKIKNSDLVALHIPEIILGNSYWSKVRRFERSFYDGTVIDCVRFIRKDIFDEVRGFDLNMTGPEDWDLDKKIRGKGKVELLDTYNFKEINGKILDTRYKILDEKELKKLFNITPKPVIFHNETNFSLNKYLTKKKYYAKSFSTYINKWGKNDPDIKKQFGFWYRYFGVFLENGKWKRLWRHPILAGGMFALRFLVGLQYQVAKIHKNKKVY